MHTRPYSHRGGRNWAISVQTRTHSSRMRTALALTIGRVCTCSGGGVPARGCTCPWEVPVRGVYLPRGCTCPGTPPVNRKTDKCKNITLSQTSFAGGNKIFIYSLFHLYRTLKRCIKMLDCARFYIKQLF